MMDRQYNNQGEKWTALYVRLSRDDENEGDSNSIQHQIEIITKYCDNHGIFRHKVYKDDGFSGTNFKRPRIFGDDGRH
jgi:DNA invertase Pin-like site-specific DNA recombinase